jgi:hypothetical protein
LNLAIVRVISRGAGGGATGFGKSQRRGGNDHSGKRELKLRAHDDSPVGTQRLKGSDRNPFQRGFESTPAAALRLTRELICASNPAPCRLAGAIGNDPLMRLLED